MEAFRRLLVEEALLLVLEGAAEAEEEVEARCDLYLAAAAARIAASWAFIAVVFYMINTCAKGQ